MLPTGWSTAVDPSSGKTYYYHVVTKQTSVREQPVPVAIKSLRFFLSCCRRSSRAVGSTAGKGAAFICALRRWRRDCHSAGEYLDCSTAPTLRFCSLCCLQRSSEVANRLRALRLKQEASAAQTQRPAAQALPEGWQAVIDRASGDTYYHNKVTNETTWTRPTAPAVRVSLFN